MINECPEKVESKLPPNLEQGSQRCLNPTLKNSVQLAKTMWTCSTGSQPFHKLGRGLEKGPSPNTVSSVPLPKSSGRSGQKGPGFQGGDSTEETMDASSPAQEQKTSSGKGTGARNELI